MPRFEPDGKGGWIERKTRRRSGQRSKCQSRPSRKRKPIPTTEKDIQHAIEQNRRYDIMRNLHE